MARKTLVVALSFLILGCAGVQLGPKHKKQEPGSPPVIVDHYAAQVIRVGENWKIILHARDEDGDMKYIAAELYQAGVGYYTVQFFTLKDTDQAEVAGYLVLPFPRDYSFWSDRFEMRIIIRDQKNNRNETLALPLRIGHWTYEEIPEKLEQAANNKLGIIILNLESSQMYNRGGNARIGD